MDTPALIKTLQDPMGIPFFPVVFQALMVLTFSLHILLVNATVGAAALAVYGRLAGGEFWTKLAGSMAKAVTMSVSALIVLGVAPLLFVQVIYDPFWYASNMLSAAWAIGFLLIMMAAFSASYAAVARGDKPGAALFGALALALFLAAGALMHVFSYQALQPERWMSWYSRAAGVDASGTTLHSFSLARYLHFIIPGLAVGGVFLMLRSWYLEPRADADRTALDRAARIGSGLAFWATAAETVAGVWWLMILPDGLRFWRNPTFIASAALGFALLGHFARVHFFTEKPQRSALASASAIILVVLAMSSAREALRMAYLARFEYSPLAQRVTLDWGSTALFFGTFALGLVVLAYVLATAFQSGRVAGRYEAGPRMQAWGRVAVGLLIAWIVVVAGLGVAVTLRNHGV